jgi:hypothetical protein
MERQRATTSGWEPTIAARRVACGSPARASRIGLATCSAKIAHAAGGGLLGDGAAQHEDQRVVGQVAFPQLEEVLGQYLAHAASRDSGQVRQVEVDSGGGREQAGLVAVVEA